MKLLIRFEILMVSLFSITLFACNSSSTGENPADEIILSIVDKNATPETKALLANLWINQEKGVMFGHHDDLLYGRNWLAEPGRSDIKDIVGDFPAVYSLDFAEIMDSKSAVDGHELNEDRRRTIIEAYERGEVITANAHINNPLTGGSAWDNSNGRTVSDVLREGSTSNIKFRRWLDFLADFANNLKDDSGTLIPIIFRPFHEHTQTWSWWGTSTTSHDDFIALWQFTIDYLKDEKGVHNFLYAISPQIDNLGTTEQLLFRWPGDDYVDFIGLDSYHGTNRDAFIRNLKNLENLSREKMKPAGVTETGIEGIRIAGSEESIEDYWTEQILIPFSGRELSMVVLWRNEYDPQNNGHHYYAPFSGENTEDNFMLYYQDEETLFSKDLSDMYSMPDNVTIK